MGRAQPRHGDSTLLQVAAECGQACQHAQHDTGKLGRPGCWWPGATAQMQALQQTAADSWLQVHGMRQSHEALIGPKLAADAGSPC